MAVFNIQTGGRKYVEITGLKEITARINQIMDATVEREAEGVILTATRAVYDQVHASARAADVPHEVYEDLYIYSRQPGAVGRRKQVTMLMGMRKAGRSFDAHAYVTWFPGRHIGKFDKTQRSRRRGGRLVLPGALSANGKGLQKIGENLGTMWEFGTTKLSPRPWYRPAIARVRVLVLQLLASGYSGIISRHSA